MNLSFAAAFLAMVSSIDAFAPSASVSSTRARHHNRQGSTGTLQVSRATETDDFASFAATLEKDAVTQKESTMGSASTSSTKTWQADLERLLDPTTPASQRQILLSDLMNANGEIKASVETALRDRKIDTLLTPRGRKLQDGTRAVARQLTNDILPSLARPPSNSNNSGATSTTSTLPFPVPPFPTPEDVSRLGNRFFNTFANQMQRNLETLQTDLANPSRIPERIAKQTDAILQEAGNIFAETPVGLKEPAYTVVAECQDYEIRDYCAYTVATTNMETDAATTNNPAEQGMAFNTLAGYIFGANAEDRVMEMTTPVTTTMSGEMRFYVVDSAPDPLKEDASKNVYDQSKIRIERIPETRLAVRRFGGFATAGEIARQKETLLAALALDAGNVELDVPHGQSVGHVVFQYNPPYTIPVLRRNEIAVPVVVPTAEETGTIEDAWEVTNGSK